MRSLLASPLGFLIGLSLGALGGGGSILAVPALVYAAGQSPKEATTTSLVLVAMSALLGIVPHWRAGRVRFAPGIVFGLAGVGMAAGWVCAACALIGSRGRSTALAAWMLWGSGLFAVTALTSFASGALVTTQGWTWLNLGSLLPVALTGAALVWMVIKQKNVQAASA